MLALVAIVATSFMVTAQASGAAATCTPADAPPRVLAVAADDVAFPPQGGFPHVAMHVTVQNACGGTASYECSSDPTTSCTGLWLQLRRAEPVGTLARYCNHRRSTYDSGDGVGPRATNEPGVYDYPMSVDLSLEYSDDNDQPAMTNACAGPWDVIVTPWNTTKTNGAYTSTRGAPFTAKNAFYLHRWSRLTTNASPEPVRRGGTVTVKGRLTRQVLAPNRLSTNANGARYVAFAGAPVVLQRRTLSGTYRSIRTVRSNKDGNVITKLKALPEDRCYRWVFRGTDTTRAVTAGGDCVHARR